MRKIISLLIILISAQQLCAQETTRPLSIEEQILALQTDVNDIKLNLNLSEKKFKRGIATATIGYTVTIAGGLMLGRKNDELGKVLLVTGGATGITGTILMVDAFKYLGRIGKRKVKP
jgi:hypothetical protein